MSLPWVRVGWQGWLGEGRCRQQIRGGENKNKCTNKVRNECHDKVKQGKGVSERPVQRGSE